MEPTLHTSRVGPLLASDKPSGLVLDLVIGVVHVYLLGARPDQDFKSNYSD